MWLSLNWCYSCFKKTFKRINVVKFVSYCVLLLFSSFSGTGTWRKESLQGLEKFPLINTHGTLPREKETSLMFGRLEGNYIELWHCSGNHNTIYGKAYCTRTVTMSDKMSSFSKMQYTHNLRQFDKIVYSGSTSHLYLGYIILVLLATKKTDSIWMLLYNTMIISISPDSQLKECTGHVLIRVQPWRQVKSAENSRGNLIQVTTNYNLTSWLSLINHALPQYESKYMHNDK